MKQVYNLVMWLLLKGEKQICFQKNVTSQIFKPDTSQDGSTKQTNRCLESIWSQMKTKWMPLEECDKQQFIEREREAL